MTADIVGLFSGVMVTGIEDDPDEYGLLRVYVGPRYNWNFVLASGNDAENVRGAWAGGGHVSIRMRDDATIYHDPEGLARSRSVAAEREAERVAARTMQP